MKSHISKCLRVSNSMSQDILQQIYDATQLHSQVHKNLISFSEGRYVLMVSLYDRLGGNILRWSKMKGQHWGGATLPIHHDGSFYNFEMKVCDYLHAG